MSFLRAHPRIDRCCLQNFLLASPFFLENPSNSYPCHKFPCRCTSRMYDWSDPCAVRLPVGGQMAAEQRRWLGRNENPEETSTMARTIENLPGLASYRPDCSRITTRFGEKAPWSLFDEACFPKFEPCQTELVEIPKNRHA